MGETDDPRPVGKLLPSEDEKAASSAELKKQFEALDFKTELKNLTAEIKQLSKNMRQTARNVEQLLEIATESMTPKSRSRKTTN